MWSDKMWLFLLTLKVPLCTLKNVMSPQLGELNLGQLYRKWMDQRDRLVRQLYAQVGL